MTKEQLILHQRHLIAHQQKLMVHQKALIDRQQAALLDRADSVPGRHSGPTGGIPWTRYDA